MSSLRETAMTLFEAAIAAADPEAAVKRQLDRHPLPPLPPGAHRFVIAVGKAAVPMMRAALEILPTPTAALVVTNPENLCNLPGAQVIAGAHPVPDETSAAAGHAVLELLAQTKAGDQVLALISGGGSALMVAPRKGLSLQDKSAANALLLASGLEITEMNLVRQQLSALKGGGLLHAAAPATVHAFLLSDVIGDDLRAIASGPTVAPLGTPTDARDLLRTHGLLRQLPDAVQTCLEAATPQREALPEAQNHLVGSNQQSLLAMKTCAEAQGWQAEIVDNALTGDVEEAAQKIAASLRASKADRPTALLFGGETTVRLRGNGRGGRNQELALHIARLCQNDDGDWVFLSGGTDGRDGPTDAAGALVDAASWSRITAAGEDPQALLDNNDSHHALHAAGNLIRTGGTGTNVADVQVLLIKP
ncbi:Putative hydroxypyruvate reductase [Tritonibacter multivorans]|uniref:Putative hydroxypyruvate reductase n=1 Tax=Tritonibacter multivorans TaxID=928856 RepID=A0A0P1GEE1_9RHOB|nr:DUF4147 domain-containing protein [Tritonibacter multivorans]MDA7420284.1 DUF4147 domain-containing protein [Tritonibacter multivorans]CUH80018.1 Putative hydroxypyruvate reductase [Tritonibacter multivorans]SFB96871.1 hydroxypyruvate reductase [Tritonibacter multivorans]